MPTGKKHTAALEKVQTLTHHLDESLSTCPFIVFDLETTGGNPTKNGITEISALLFQNGEVKDKFYSLVNPRVSIPAVVRRMTGISNRTVKNAPTIDEVMPKFMDFIKSYVLVSHNTIGDLKFVEYFAKKTCGIDVKNYFLCTHLLTEKLLPQAPDKSLKGLETYLKLDRGGGKAHRAESDALVTLELFRELLNRLQQVHHIDLVGDAVRYQGDFTSGFRLGLAIPFDRLNLPNGPGIFSLVDRDEKVTFISSVFDLRREVLALRDIEAQPRWLSKLLLQARNLTFESHSNIYSAMLAEADAYGRHHLHAHNGLQKWRQRFIPAIYISEEHHLLRISVGLAPRGVVAMFGPVRDRRKAEEFLDEIAELFGTKNQRSGLHLPLAYRSALEAFFTGALTKELKRSSLEALSLRTIIGSATRRDMWRKLYFILKLMKFPQPLKLESLLANTGVVVTRRHGGHGWEVHPIVCGHAGPAVIVHQRDWRDWLKVAEGLDFLAQLRSREATAPEKTVEERDLLKLHATLWVIYSYASRDRGHISYKNLSDLEQLAEEPAAESTGTPVHTN